MTFRFNKNTALAALVAAASTGALAAPISLTGVSGTYSVYDGSPTLSLVAPTLANAATALGGSAAAPSGNIELSKFGGPVSVLTGTGSGHTITLSSLTLSDWTANSNSLAISYIQGAALAGLGFQLTAPQLTTALTNFYGLNIGGGLKSWQLVSDPNVSYVDINGSAVSVGLAGLLDASAFLTGISGIPLAPGKQASEVVKMTFDGSGPVYLYGFSATPSGLHTNGGAFTGNYDVKFVPEPATLALVGLGLLGLLTRRRRI